MLKNLAIYSSILSGSTSSRYGSNQSSFGSSAGSEFSTLSNQLSASPQELNQSGNIKPAYIPSSLFVNGKKSFASGTGAGSSGYPSVLTASLSRQSLSIKAIKSTSRVGETLLKLCPWSYFTPVLDFPAFVNK